MLSNLIILLIINVSGQTGAGKTYTILGTQDNCNSILNIEENQDNVKEKLFNVLI